MELPTTRLAVRMAVIENGHLVRSKPSSFGWMDHRSDYRVIQRQALDNLSINSPMREKVWFEFDGTEVPNSRHYGLEVDVELNGETRTWRYEGSMGDLIMHTLGISERDYF